MPPKRPKAKDRARRRQERFTPARYLCSECRRFLGWRQFRQSPPDRLICRRCVTS